MMPSPRIPPISSLCFSRQGKNSGVAETCRSACACLKGGSFLKVVERVKVGGMELWGRVLDVSVCQAATTTSETKRT